MAKADDPIKFQRMHKIRLQLERQQVNAIGMTKPVFTDELQPINPLDRNISRDNFNGVVINPTQDTLDFMRDKHRNSYCESNQIPKIKTKRKYNSK